VSAVPPVGLIARFDVWADERLEPLRHRPVIGRVFTAASRLGDHSVIWHLVAAGRGVTSDLHADQAMAFSAMLGIESLVVNQGVKRLFKRVRPTESGDERFIVRRPSTSSFPSGHASSGFFAASVLTAMCGRRTAPLWFGVATVVGTSRAFVRIHHASDVVGGAALGLALAVGGRRLIGRLGLDRRK
jgi:membrane-associated phospholipid phosphatase